MLYNSSNGLPGTRHSNLSMLKKKKKKKDIEKQMEANIRREIETTSEPTSSTRSVTQAERRFMERRRKMEADRILKKASKTHKEKVEDFNRHLDSLTEHFDIPKVSWTK
ncbi:protein FAM32A isoform X3 [Cherax quadricarinatus]|uniref:protein FAM32A isoform X3 n=1 Tax=Cherax quadricarinatus TaxID=27406 RepID=UPI002379B44A|nr:protein FAM32A-like isoform X2 [Cherax quadricarinatus]